MTRTLRTGLLALALLWVGPAHARDCTTGTTTTGDGSDTGICGFQQLRIVGLDVTLDSRFGLGSGTDVEHFVNRADCYRYLGKDVPPVCTGSTSTTDTPDAGSTEAETSATADTASSADNGTVDTGAAAVGEPTSPSDPCPSSCAQEGMYYCCGTDHFYLCDGGVLSWEAPCDVAGCTDGTTCGVGCPDCPAGQVCSSDGECVETGAEAPGKADDGDTTTDGTDAEELTSADAGFIVTILTDQQSAALLNYNRFGVAVGTSCSLSTFPETDSTNCSALPNYPLQDWDDWATEINVTVMMKDFLGTECGGSGEKRLYFYAGYGDDQLDVSDLVFDLDYDAPSAPTLDEVKAGETNLVVKWTDSKNPDSTSYKVYYATAPFTSDDLGDAQWTGALNPKDNEYQLEGLVNNQAYYVGVTAVDSAGNQSGICSSTALLQGTPLLVDDFWELYKAAGGQEEGGYCFVATAAWNSPLAPAVKTLQSYRDEHLLTNEGGQALVQLYYRIGPGVASTIAAHPELRFVARMLLFPLVLTVLLVIGLPAWGPLAGAFGAWALRRRLGRGFPRAQRRDA